MMPITLQDELELNIDGLLRETSKVFRFRGLFMKVYALRLVVRDFLRRDKAIYEQLMLAEIELAALSNHPRAVRALECIGKAKGLLSPFLIWAALVVTMPGDDFRRASRGAHRGPSVIKVEGWQ